jgi:hypothetical protein
MTRISVVGVKTGLQECPLGRNKQIISWHAYLQRQRRVVRPSLTAHVDQAGDRVSFHLMHHFASVCLDRDFADLQFKTDLFI